jgi:uncharacterized protein (TIGR00369 family)
MSHDPQDKLDEPKRHGLARVDDGPWAGWYHWEPVDFFEEHAGPFYCQPEGEGPDAPIVCAFMPQDKNRNGGGNIHGGALMTFADYALFMIAGGMETSVHGVTMTMNCEFVGAAELGQRLTARGEVVRQGMSVAFVRGIIDDEGRPIMAFSGTIKKFKPRA